MGIYRHFPYTNFHEMNMDEILKIVKTMSEEWENTKQEWASYKDYIDNYFNTLDLSEETYNVILRMIENGVFNETVDPVIINEVESWLNENINNGFVVDRTLSISGAAADARITGNNFKLKVNIPLDEHNQPDNGTDGQLLRTKGDGETEWVDIGLPTDEQTAQAVSEWLNEHPEATTTVVDGSLTDAKFSNNLKLQTINDYVTPEMFGATGDGITDDTQAFVDAITYTSNSFGLPSIPIYGMRNKRYKITELNVARCVIAFCDFIGNGISETDTDGIILGSGALISKCNFVDFRNAIIIRPQGSVLSVIENSTFQYCGNGIYFDMESATYQINQLTIRGNYFVKCGNADNKVDDQDETYIVNGYGYGLYIAGNIANAIINGNTFDKCGYVGLSLTATGNYNIGCQITNNYFESSKNCPIYVNVKDNVAHQITIDANYFSPSLVNVYGSTLMNIEKCCSIYTIKDKYKWILGNSDSANTHLNNQHQFIIDSTIASQYLTLNLVNRTLLGVNEYVKIKCWYIKDTEQSNIVFKHTSASEPAITLTEGYNEIDVKAGSSYYISRKPIGDEYIIFVDIVPNFNL